MRNLYLVISASLLITYFPSRSQIMLDSTVIDTATVISGIDIPWEIIWGPDDWIWMTERYGRVSRVDPNTGMQVMLLDLSASVYQQSESGLLGMALHPDFNNTPHVFLAYTYLDGTIKERMVRYEYDGNSLVNPFTIVENIPGNTTHNGSRLLILPDTTIIMTTGDAQAQASAQDINSLSGKILRYTLDGNIPADNPFAGNPVWTWGHRNAQGLLLAPNGRIYSSEHGPTTDDELNLIEKGRNYGWPTVHGLCDSPPETAFCNDSNVFEPLLNWTPTIATSDIAWYSHPSIPEFNNSILMAVLKDQQLVRIKLDATGTQITENKEYFNGTWGRLRDICISPDGTIYLATNGAQWSNNDPFTHSIVRLKNSNHPVGITEKTESVKLWPQPANSLLNLICGTWQGGSFEIHEVTGKLLKKGQLNSQLLAIDVSPWPSGMYILVLKKGHQTKTEKFILQ